MAFARRGSARCTPGPASSSPTSTRPARAGAGLQLRPRYLEGFLDAFDLRDDRRGGALSRQPGRRSKVDMVRDILLDDRRRADAVMVGDRENDREAAQANRASVHPVRGRVSGPTESPEDDHGRCGATRSFASALLDAARSPSSSPFFFASEESSSCRFLRDFGRGLALLLAPPPGRTSDGSPWCRSRSPLRITPPRSPIRRSSLPPQSGHFVHRGRRTSTWKISWTAFAAGALVAVGGHAVPPELGELLAERLRDHGGTNSVELAAETGDLLHERRVDEGVLLVRAEEDRLDVRGRACGSSRPAGTRSRSRRRPAARG